MIVTDTRIKTHGLLDDGGNASQNVIFKNVDLYFGSDADTTVFLNLASVEWAGGSFLDTSFKSCGSFDIDNNSFNDANGL